MRPRRISSPWRDHCLWIEVFALLNITGLAADIALAHRMNFFREHAEYMPLGLSIAAPLFLVPAIFFYVRGARRPWAILGHIMGWACILVGIAGVVFHLNSSFFQARTLASLVYSAPFAAPLAYTGLGLLLIMNRMVAPDDPDWPMWILLLALGGYVGNLIFSITDHAQNAFYYHAEWASVVAGAYGVAFLFTLFITRISRTDIILCALVMLDGALIGIIGFYFHASADLSLSDASLISRFVYGAPIFAPLLFVDMAILALIGLRVLWSRTRPT